MQAITTPQVDDTSAAGRISCAICTSLLADHPDALETVIWAKAVKEVYLLGRAWVAEGVERGRAYRELRLLIRALGEQFAQVKGHPCQTLAKRLLRQEARVVRLCAGAGGVCRQ